MKNRNVATKLAKPRFGFIHETINELKKVVWLSWHDVYRLTVLVMVVTIAVGIVLGIIDFGFSKLVDTMFLP
jgi:preprotein translocase subunit SecE